ncbi:hypothetical protein Tco_1441286 [Tanacetum coccineum]
MVVTVAVERVVDDLKIMVMMMIGFMPRQQQWVEIKAVARRGDRDVGYVLKIEGGGGRIRGYGVKEMAVVGYGGLKFEDENDDKWCLWESCQ